MLTDWIHWLSSMPPDRLALLLLPMLLVDMPRYVVPAVTVCLCDLCRDACIALGLVRDRRTFDYCPSVSVVIAGLNEAGTIGRSLESLWGSYPNLDIIVVDDGSSDGMTDVARTFAETHSRVLVLRKPQRGGKSSALNFALAYARSEIIVCVDGDSRLSPHAIWEIVQPFREPDVGAVSGAVLARNPFAKMVTWLQAFEYLRGIFVGRMYMARMGILGIISGAFGAYRRDALLRVQGWDVGPGEDGDLTLRLRRAGYRVEYVPYAQCHTNLPRSWWQLLRQRRRWDWGAVTFECRKHAEMGNPFSPSFRLSNLAMQVDRWFLNVVFVYGLWAYAAWLLFHVHEHTWKQLFLYYALYVLGDMVMLMVVMYYSTNRRRDLAVGLAAPLMPFYHVLLRIVSLWAITEEIFTRRSFRDGFVPPHVRRATWHW